MYLEFKSLVFFFISNVSGNSYIPKTDLNLFETDIDITYLGSETVG